MRVSDVSILITQTKVTSWAKMEDLAWSPLSHSHSICRALGLTTPRWNLHNCISSAYLHFKRRLRFLSLSLSLSLPLFRPCTPSRTRMHKFYFYVCLLPGKLCVPVLLIRWWVHSQLGHWLVPRVGEPKSKFFAAKLTGAFNLVARSSRDKCNTAWLGAA